MLISKTKKTLIRQNHEICFKHAFSVYFLYSKKGKIQTGLNCEYDGLSEVMLRLSHSRLLSSYFHGQNKCKNISSVHCIVESALKSQLT